MEAHFVIIQRNGKAKKFKLFPNEYLVIGRGEKCQIQIDDNACSSTHCKIECFENSIKVTDLESKNGIYINNARTLEQNLYVDDKLKVGDSFIYINIKRMKEDSIKKLVYKGKEARAIGNLTIELDRKKDENTKNLKTKQNKQKISQFKSLDNKQDNNLNQNSYHRKARVSKEVPGLAKALIIIIDINFILLLFFLLMFLIKQTYPQLTTLGLNISFIEFVFKAEVILFSLISILSSIILFKVLKKILRGSIGELLLGIKK